MLVAHKNRIKKLLAAVKKKSERRQAETFLREIAFVLKMTAKVKQDMITGR